MYEQKQVPYRLRTIDFGWLASTTSTVLKSDTIWLSQSPHSSAPSPPASDPEPTPSITM